MRRISITLLAVAVALVVALPAGAKGPPEGKGKPDPVVGMACADWYEGAILVDYRFVNTFTLSISEKGSTCVDLVNVPRGEWTVDVRVGSAREVTVQLRSSVPGDWCWVEFTKEDKTFTFLDTPASAKNACPDGGAGGESIPDEDPALAFTVLYTGSKRLTTPVEIIVTLP